MKLQFLGTGAADFDWSRIGEEGIRGSTSTLINGHILIDAGTTGWENLTRFGIDPNAIDTILITHSHSDHFNPAVIAKIISARRIGNSPVQFYAAPQALARLDKSLPLQTHPLEIGMKFATSDFEIVTLPGNHFTGDYTETTFHFMFLSDAGNMLYLLDGAWMTTKARYLIGKTKIATVVWEATMQNPADYRIFEHSDLCMLDQMKQVLLQDGVFSSATKIYLSHIARTLWVPDPADQDRIAAARGYTMTHDGMCVEV